MYRCPSPLPCRFSFPPIVLAVLLAGTSSSIASNLTAAVVVDAGTGAVIDQIQDSATSTLRSHGWEIRFAERTFQVQELRKCKTGDCLGRALAIRPDIVFVLEARQNSNAPGGVIEGRILSGEDASILAQQQQPTASMQPTSLHNTVVSLTKSLLKQLPRYLTNNECLLTIHVAPLPAYVSVDGKPHGPSELQWRIPAGTHTLTISREGFQTITKTIALSRGVRELSFRLKPRAKTPIQTDVQRRQTKPPRRFGPWKWLPIGTGAAATALGITWIAIHESETKNGVLRADRRNTRTFGIVSTVIGAGLLGVGTVMWISDRNKRNNQTHITVHPHGTNTLLFSILGSF